MDEDQVKSLPNVQTPPSGPVQRVATTNAAAMAPRVQYGKEGSDTPICENEGCSNEMPVQFHVNLGKETKKYCEGCYREFWRERGYIRQ